MARKSVQPDSGDVGRYSVVTIAFWDAGGHPPWNRVWRDDVDVPDEDPETWPEL